MDTNIYREKNSPGKIKVSLFSDKAMVLHFNKCESLFPNILSGLIDIGSQEDF